MSWSGGLAVVRLPVIAGPTASGKSALVLALARYLPLTVISADSRQLYRGFDIGTAKPSAAERQAVPHELIDLGDPAERFTAARWADAAGSAIDCALANGRIPVVVGGTGLYLRALFEPLFHEPAMDPVARAALAVELATQSTEALRERVALLDPARAHLGRTQLLRAIEVAVLTGIPISDWHARSARAARFTASYALVDPGAVLHDRIESRIDTMWGGGWLAEVRGLDATVPEAAPAWNATGYALVRAVVRGLLDPDTARERIVIATRQYAKRQRTWFRHQLDEDMVMRLDPDASRATGQALDWLRAWGRP